MRHAHHLASLLVFTAAAGSIASGCGSDRDFKDSDEAGGAGGAGGQGGAAGTSGKASSGSAGKANAGSAGQSGATSSGGAAGSAGDEGMAGGGGEPARGGEGGTGDQSNGGGQAGEAGEGGRGGSNAGGNAGGEAGAGAGGSSSCTDACASGETACSEGELAECELVDGCWAWSEAEDCVTGACASATACAVCNATTPECVDSNTERTCTGGVWSTSDCGGSEPVCLDGAGCQPCTEHYQCPESACHLAGDKKGQCFATSTVVEVATAAALQNALGSLASGSERVLRLTSSSYQLTASVTLNTNSEVAIIGNSNTFVGGTPGAGGDARNAVFNVSGGITYLSRVNFSGTASMSALSVSAQLWLDDLTVSGYYRALASSGEVHVRRSALRSTGIGTYIAAGLAFMENSAIGPNGSAYGVSLNNGATVDFRYMTIAGSSNAIECPSAAPAVAGTVRNSILASTAGNSIVGGTNGSNCDNGISFVNIAVDQDGYDAVGEQIGWYNAAWFENAATGNFRLTAAGQAAIPAIAARGTGDPLVDIDGQARPTSNGYPGLDEP